MDEQIEEFLELYEAYFGELKKRTQEDLISEFECFLSLMKQKIETRLYKS